MRNNKVKNMLPEDYFEGKDGLAYRFTILKDIAVAGAASPISYDDARQDSIFRLYDRYDDFALYLHFPWCIEHCSYCHYYQGPMLKRNQLESLLEAEKKHAHLMDERIDLSNRNVRSIYFGGGTPTVVPADMLDETIGYYVSRYRRNEACEVCLEASIITLKPKKVEILERYVNRLSVGVQSFDDEVLTNHGPQTYGRSSGQRRPDLRFIRSLTLFNGFSDITFYHTSLSWKENG